MGSRNLSRADVLRRRLVKECHVGSQYAAFLDDDDDSIPYLTLTF
jgi:hypothetical protein